MKTIHINSRIIGESYPAFIIAEIGVNHNGSKDLALQLIDKAIEAGADAVKFQKRNLNKIYPKRLLSNPNRSEKSLNYLLPILKKVELSEQDFKEIYAYCKKRNIIFFATPFDADSADFLEKLDVPVYKVASADLTNLPLLDHLVTKRKPLILSTGMSTEAELNQTVDFLHSRSAEFALLHCNSTYPAPFDNINLRYLQNLKNYSVPVGYSGHERGTEVSIAAVVLGASIIERHITMDRSMEGPDHKASLQPEEFKSLVDSIRNVELALGDGESKKHISVGEKSNRDVLAKSLVAAVAIRSGDKITKRKVTVKGPGLGLSPLRINEVIGKIAKRSIQIDEPFTEVDLRDNLKYSFKKSLPYKWGFVVRMRDFQSLLKHKPLCVEFHFTDKDLDDRYTFRHHKQELIVHAPEFFGNSLVDLCTSDAARRESSIKIIQLSIDKARQMGNFFHGKSKVIVHPGAMSVDSVRTKKERFRDNLIQSLRSLRYKGVELLLENLPPRPWYFGGQWVTHYFMDAVEIKNFSKKTGINICFDISHSKLYCNMYHKTINQQIEILLPYIRHLHISDASGIDGEGLQIGMGTVNFSSALTALKRYKNTMVPEIWRGHLDNGKGFLEALEKLSAIVESTA